MSPKRLRWTGLACVALSPLTAAFGFVAQSVCVILWIVLFHVTVQVPLGAVGGSVGPTVLPIPRVLPTALLGAGLLLLSGLACLFESRRRRLAWRRHA